MIPDKQDLTAMASRLGATGSAVFPTGDIKFSDHFRKMCEQNYCGHYGKNYMCPPHVGGMEELNAAVREYSSCLLVQTVTPLEDSYDFEGMEEAAATHTKVLDEIHAYFGNKLGIKDTLKLGVGRCLVCEECAISEGLPCRDPENATASVEAYCMDVRKMCEEHGLKYINGENTVSYVGLIAF